MKLDNVWNKYFFNCGNTSFKPKLPKNEKFVCDSPINFQLIGLEYLRLLEKSLYKFIIILSFSTILLSSCSKEKDKVNDKPKLTIAGSMSADDSLFKKAIEKREFTFPEDHGAHNDYKLEWWYFTGNLKAENGQEFSYQFTIFRNALKPDSNSLNSNFATNQLYFYHFAITDISNNKFYFYDDFARGAGGLAGAESNPLKIFVNNSFITGKYGADSSLPIFNINAIADKFRLKLELIPQKNVVLQGDEGLSQKSFDKNNNSYYYSITRLESKGELSISEEKSSKSYKVKGESWLDREWSTSALSKEQVGWDWFSIQLSDSTEIMYFKLRNKDGSTNFAKGSIINKNGSKRNLRMPEVFLEEKDYWTNDLGKKYPSKWILSIPENNIKLNIETRVKDQELKLNIRYYEGSIRINGFNGKYEVNGLGYVEMTGYSE